MKHSVFIAVFCFFTLTGCTTSILQNQIFEGEQVNVTEVSYAAADMLIQQTKAFVTADTSLQIGMLTDMRRPDKPTALGRMIPSHIGSRFVQLGYEVTASSFQAMTGMPQEEIIYNGNVNEYSGSSSRDGYAEKALITGHYVVARKEVLVSLRIIETGSGKVLAAYDYSLPLSGDIKEMIHTDDDSANSGSFLGIL
jgi:hypothetical protein